MKRSFNLPEAVITVLAIAAITAIITGIVLTSGYLFTEKIVGI